MPEDYEYTYPQSFTGLNKSIYTIKKKAFHLEGFPALKRALFISFHLS